MAKPHFVCIFGTRPEAIKMAPVVKSLGANDKVELSVVVTEQHKEMLEPVLDFFEIRPHERLNVMRRRQNLAELTGRILCESYDAIGRLKPDLVIVHGDTTTTAAASMSSFYHKIPVAHVEAGLRTGNTLSPWPEEMNRRLTANLTEFHFAPTTRARDALHAEGIPADKIWVTGNTVIDALLIAKSINDTNRSSDSLMLGEIPAKQIGRRRVLVTSHRRENLEYGIGNLCRAIATLAERPDVDFVFPVHLNPVVQDIVRPSLGSLRNVHLLEPLDYPMFVEAMREADIILTDSGGIQEEAPTFGVPVLVLRDTSERPEAIEAGTAKLVGTDADAIVAHVVGLIENEDEYRRMAEQANPYGDGTAAIKITKVLLEEFGV